MKNTSFKCNSINIYSVVMAITLTLSVASAQIAKPGYDDKLLFRGVTGVTIGAAVQQWTLSDTGTFRQFSAPISISLPVSNRILFSLTNSGSSSSSDNTTVSGINDTRVSFSYVLPGDKVWLTGGASFPTGKTKLDKEKGELDLSKYISQTAFAFRVPVFGQGFSGNAGLAYATPITRRLVFGIGTSFFYRGAYDPIKLTSDSLSLDYNPGDELSMNIGVDYITYSKIARFSIDLTGTYFLEDQLNGQKIFQSGPRVTLFGVYSIRTGEYNHLLNIRVRYRLQNTYYNSGVSTKYDAAVQTEGQYSISRQLNDWLVGSATGEIKNYSADQIPFAGSIIKTGNAAITSLGFDLLLVVSDIVSPTVSMRYAFGTATIADDAFNEIRYAVSGIEAGLGLKISF